MKLENPIAENEAYLRQSIVDTLARRAEHNLAHMEGNIRLFEIGDVFPGCGVPLPVEELHVAALVMGRRFPPHFSDPKSDQFTAWALYDASDIKALALGIAEAANPGCAVGLEPGASVGEPLPGTRGEWKGPALWVITVDGQTCGQIGEIRVDAPVWSDAGVGVRAVTRCHGREAGRCAAIARASRDGPDPAKSWCTGVAARASARAAISGDTGDAGGRGGRRAPPAAECHRCGRRARGQGALEGSCSSDSICSTSMLGRGSIPGSGALPGD